MKNNNNTIDKGRLAEEMAGRYLEKQGLVILARNYSCRSGEIDLICHDKHTLVFVEVRFRKDSRFGGASASITKTKQRKIISAAQHYLIRTMKVNQACRFDCVLLDEISDDHIEWIRNAFSAD